MSETVTPDIERDAYSQRWFLDCPECRDGEWVESLPEEEYWECPSCDYVYDRRED